MAAPAAVALQFTVGDRWIDTCLDVQTCLVEASYVRDNRARCCCQDRVVWCAPGCSRAWRSLVQPALPRAVVLRNLGANSACRGCGRPPVRRAASVPIGIGGRRRERFPWVLRIDIAKFFPSSEHDMLLDLIRPHTPADLRWLARRVLRVGGPCEHVAFHFPGDLLAPCHRPHGLPIGKLTSQVWANAMLTPVDHLLASRLGIGTFVRYCDDLLVYSDDRGRPIRVRPGPR